MKTKIIIFNYEFSDHFSYFGFKIIPGIIAKQYIHALTQLEQNRF
jgi:hypothetical protein